MKGGGGGGLGVPPANTTHKHRKQGDPGGCWERSNDDMRDKSEGPAGGWRRHEYDGHRPSTQNDPPTYLGKWDIQVDPDQNILSVQIHLLGQTLHVEFLPTGRRAVVGSKEGSVATQETAG
jgi:hypothetical protein